MADLDVTRMDDGRFVTSDGEIIDLPEGGDMLAIVAGRHRAAHEQEKEWARLKAIYGQMILKLTDEPRQTVGELVVSLNSRPVKTLEGEAFANMVYERYEGAFTGAPDRRQASDVLQVLAAVKTLDETKLPEPVRKFLPACQAITMSRTWVETALVRKAAPKLPKGDAAVTVDEVQRRG